MWRHAPMAHSELMFHNNQLTSAISADRQTRLRNAANRQRLVRRNKAPSADGPPTGFLSVVWPDESERVSQQSARCVG
jgi:hypothetical protein